MTSEKAIKILSSVVGDKRTAEDIIGVLKDDAEKIQHLEEKVASLEHLLQNMTDGIKESMSGDDEKIAHLQIALDKANEKLAYVWGDGEPPFYDEDSGRDQLKAWMSAWKFEAMMEGRKIGGRWKKYDETIYRCTNCGAWSPKASQFCFQCGALMISEKE